jgi:prefoldin subunit 5
MKRFLSKISIVFMAIIIFLCSASFTEDSADEAGRQAVETGPSKAREQNEVDLRDSVKTSTENSTEPLSAVKTVSFYLMSGRLVTGRLISEDKNKMTVEELDESRIIVSTYGKKEIDSRTIRQTKMPEIKYYLELAEYFESRIWDFRDDPDDFTQAIRFYEKAREIVKPSEDLVPVSAAEIEETINHLREQQNLWARNVKTRAELKKLEFEATFDVRLSELNDRINGLGQTLSEMSERLDGIVKRRQGDDKKFENRLSKMNRTTNAKLRELESKIELNEREIDRLWRRGYRYYPRYYYRSPRPDDDSSK